MKVRLRIVRNNELFEELGIETEQEETETWFYFNPNRFDGFWIDDNIIRFYISGGEFTCVYTPEIRDTFLQITEDK